jgi:hypothetical protein
MLSRLFGNYWLNICQMCDAGLLRKEGKRRRGTMPNNNKDKKNQPPTGEGKKQSPRSGEANKLNKRSEVLQAQRGHAEQNITGDENEELAVRGEGLNEPGKSSARKKAGR